MLSRVFSTDTSANNLTMKHTVEQTTAQYAEVARAYFKHHSVFRYRQKKITDMTDNEVVQKCHWLQEENNMVDDYWAFVKENFPDLA